MSERHDLADDTDRSYRFDRLAGVSIIGAFVLSLALLVVGHPLFWVPFAVGLGIGLPGFAILADRERDRSPLEDGDADGSESVDADGSATSDDEEEST